MRIEGLTSEQVKILDELWACETQEDLEQYVANKSEKQLQEIITLREMIISVISMNRSRRWADIPT